MLCEIVKWKSIDGREDKGTLGTFSSWVEEQAIEARERGKEGIRKKSETGETMTQAVKKSCGKESNLEAEKSKIKVMGGCSVWWELPPGS